MKKESGFLLFEALLAVSILSLTLTLMVPVLGQCLRSASAAGEKTLAVNAMRARLQEWESGNYVAGIPRENFVSGPQVEERWESGSCKECLCVPFEWNGKFTGTGTSREIVSFQTFLCQGA